MGNSWEKSGIPRGFIKASEKRGQGSSHHQRPTRINGQDAFIATTKSAWHRICRLRLGKNKKNRNQSNQPIPSPPIWEKNAINSPGGDFQKSLTSHPKSFRGEKSQAWFSCQWLYPTVDGQVTDKSSQVSKCQTQMAKNHQPILEMDLEVMKCIAPFRNKHLWKKVWFLSTFYAQTWEGLMVSLKNWKDLKGHSSSQMRYYFTNIEISLNLFNGSHFPKHYHFGCCFFRPFVSVTVTSSPTSGPSV